MRKYIGLSLSFCMLDILEGRISIEEIAGIITSTKFDTLEQAVDMYQSTYWKKFSKEYCTETLESVWSLIFQPRLNVLTSGHMVGHGFWLNTETGELLKSLI